MAYSKVLEKNFKILQNTLHNMRIYAVIHHIYPQHHFRGIANYTDSFVFKLNVKFAMQIFTLPQYIHSFIQIIRFAFYKEIAQENWKQ